MKTQVLTWTLAALLMVLPITHGAHAGAILDRMSAEWRAAPAAPPPGYAAFAPNPKAPNVVVQIVYAPDSENRYSRETLTPAPDRTLRFRRETVSTSDDGTQYYEYSGAYDSYGLILLYLDQTDGRGLEGSIRRTRIILTGIVNDLFNNGTFTIQGRELMGPNPLMGWNETCIYQGGPQVSVVRSCSGPEEFIEDPSAGDKWYRKSDWQGQVGFSYLPAIGIFVSSAAYDDRVINAPAPEVEDYRIGDQPWHSQQISAALSPQQQDQARSLFAKGFELYKSSEFSSAKSLFEAGLKIDPGNALAYNTLGEIGRSARRAGAPEGRNKAWIFSQFERVVDLSPDSPEGIVAAGYIKNGVD